ncbi:MAG: exodeoxyribonuclease VII large subunit [Acidobacteriota bacterium]
MISHPSTSEVRDQRKVWTVGELVASSRELLEEKFPAVFVRGEISNFHRHSSGHWYFKLKDEEALLDVAMFRNANSAVPFDVEEGMEVIAGGQLTIYPRRGAFQLVAELLEPVGWGALQLAFEQLRTRLHAEGLFDEQRKRPLPLLPTCVGVVTSASGAAWRDLLRVWRRRRVPIRAILTPARVQGPGAAQEIAAAIETLNRHGRAQVLIVSRGGGSREDLWAFNEETVARAIAASAIPVIAAVGHEIDTTIAELVADRRAATPTAAAEIVAASRQELVGRLLAARRQTASALSRRLLEARARLNDPRLRRRLGQPASLLSFYRQRLDDGWNRLSTPIGTILRRRRQRLQAMSHRLVQCNPLGSALRHRNRLSAAGRQVRSGVRRQLQARDARLVAAAVRVEALSPLAVLARGYSICARRRDGLIVRRSSDVQTGEGVRVRLARGQIDCKVERVTEETGPA